MGGRFSVIFNSVSGGTQVNSNREDAKLVKIMPKHSFIRNTKVINITVVVKMYIYCHKRLVFRFFDQRIASNPMGLTIACIQISDYFMHL